MNISARPRKQDCWPNGQLGNLSCFLLPSSPGGSTGRAAWDMLLSGRGASECCCLAGGPIALECGGSRGRQGVDREMGSHPEVLVPKCSPLHREGIELLKSSVPQRANGVHVQLAPVGSTCHSPQPSAWDATSSSPSQSLYDCRVLPFVTKAAITTGTLFQALGDVCCSPLVTHL